MNYEEYRRHDGLGLAQLVASGQVSAGELLETAISRAEQVNPQLNAIIHPLYEAARARADKPSDGPFAGVPFLVKDLFQDVAGTPTASGCRGLKDANFRPEVNSELVERFIAVGLNIFGKTNTPEFGAKAITEPEAFGATRNPWNTDHIPGGSSGGSAAAVAAGIVPVAGANDGGGSIRNPAACCGVFGLKPGRGRTPIGPMDGEVMHGAAVNGVVSRSVRDSAAMLDAIQGFEPGASMRVAPPERPYLEAAKVDPKPLTIGFTCRSPLGTAVHSEAINAVEHTAKLLESLGHRVVEAEPQMDGAQMSEDFLLMWFARLAATVADVKQKTGCSNSGFELETLGMAELGRALSARDYVAAFNRWHDYRRALVTFHESHDLLLTPTLAHPPARIGEIAMASWQRAALRILLPLRAGRLLLQTGIARQIAHENLRWVPFTQLANLTGVPAMSVPLYMTAAQLPLGSQFVAPVGGEDLLLSLAGQLERAAPWADREPPL